MRFFLHVVAEVGSGFYVNKKPTTENNCVVDERALISYWVRELFR